MFCRHCVFSTLFPVCTDLMWSWLSLCWPGPGTRRRRRRWRRTRRSWSRSPGRGTRSGSSPGCPGRARGHRSRRTWPARRWGSPGTGSGTPWQSPLTSVSPCHGGHAAQILSRVTCLTTVVHFVSWITNLECEGLCQKLGQSFM